jgi:hypothetical protein
MLSTSPGPTQPFAVIPAADAAAVPCAALLRAAPALFAAACRVLDSSLEAEDLDAAVAELAAAVRLAQDTARG